MSSQTQILDRGARETAETTFDRNVVVVAGAGTGKTTLLVNRLVHLLMKEPHPVKITEIIALTFTNKAATEMKVRLRERLAVLADAQADGPALQDGGAVSSQELQTRYGLTANELTVRARAGLQDLEKAQIGTLHSFAAHLLRLFPLESAVDPAFQEDDGLRFGEHFTQAGDLWIDAELSRHGTQHPVWRQLLARTTMEEIRDFAFALCSDLVDLERLQRQLELRQTDPFLAEWLGQLVHRGRELLRAHDRPKRRKVEQMLAASLSLLDGLAKQGLSALESLDPSDRSWLEKDLGNRVEGWEKSEFHEAKSLIEASQQLLRIDHSFFKQLLNILAPFAQRVRDAFADKGWLSFDGLLARARRLLWEHRAVRERIKRDYRAVLVDEFQDTDPVQYDIILAVSERPGRHAITWQEMVLEPGKLFIVGDPKQSIYAFRRADIEAFDRVVEKIAADGGIVQTLTTNFRSDAAVLGPINDLFDRLFVRRPLVQPANVRLEVRPQRRPSDLVAGVRLLMTTPSKDEERFDAAAAVRAEGEVLARWLKEEVLARSNVKGGQVALLFRKLTQADAYLDALRRYDIPYVIEGEKHFYRRQEVIDLVNVLRALDHPQDRIALVGLLRSPLGGLTDRELFELQEAGLLDYLAGPRLAAFDHPRAATVRRLYAQLAWLQREIPAFSLAEAIQLVFDRLPILELAAASLHGEQAVANLLKVKQTAASLSDRAHLTLSGFVELMVQRLDEQPEEAESPLSEESSEAVQILTIHKAKGLEFPVVVLPGLHQGSGRDGTIPHVVYDWSSGAYGLSLGERRTLGAVVAQAKFAQREEAERRRVLYVGMTRAKELLVLSGGVAARSVGETTLDWLREIGQGAVGEAATKHVQIGSSLIPHHVVQASERTWRRRVLSKETPQALVDPPTVARIWKERTERWEKVRLTPWRVTPTSLHKPAAPSYAGAEDRDADREVGRLVGVVAHRLLEQWDFQGAPQELVDRIAPAVQAALQSEQSAIGPSVESQLQELFLAFTESESYKRLQSAAIIGREVPCVMPWKDGQVMEGVIDLLYRLDGTIWIADYKTDRVTAEEVRARAADYAQQAFIYTEAVRRSLGMQAVGFEFLFLRPAVRVEI